MPDQSPSVTFENEGKLPTGTIWMCRCGRQYKRPVVTVDWLADARRERDTMAALERLAQHLTVEAMTKRCELTNSAGGRCSNESIAVRWEHGFADFVCEEHAASAAERGALVVHARRHDGDDG